jgi:uncharacterized membrane protein YdjX (TVP38/TMEM64 family)
MNTVKSSLLRQLPFLAILAVALVGAAFLRPYLGFEALAQHREALVGLVTTHYLFAALGFVAAYIVIVALSLPGATVATLTGGFLFGLFPGVLFNLTGATLGAILIFLAARMGLGERLAARIDATPGAVQRLKRGIDENQWSVLFLMRLVPVVPFFVANVLPALLNVPLRRFAITTALGIVPGGLVYTSVGAGLGEVLAAGEQPDLGVIFEPHILGPLLGLAALAALPMVIKMFRREARL